MTKEEAKETVRRIFNFCEEIDYSLPDDEKIGYRMVHDVFTLLRYIDDVVEVKHGHWELDGTRSVCGKHTLQSYGNFCCYCGSDMRGETE